MTTSFLISGHLNQRRDAILLLLLRKDTPIPDNNIELINESLSILAEPLKRALDYEEIFEQARKDTLTGSAQPFGL